LADEAEQVPAVDLDADIRAADIVVGLAQVGVPTLDGEIHERHQAEVVPGDDFPGVVVAVEAEVSLVVRVRNVVLHGGAADAAADVKTAVSSGNGGVRGKRQAEQRDRKQESPGSHRRALAVDGCPGAGGPGVPVYKPAGGTFASPPRRGPGPPAGRQVKK
jgi:hypothetical protein